MGFGLTMCTVLDAGMTLSCMANSFQCKLLQLKNINGVMSLFYHELAASHLHFL